MPVSVCAFLSVLLDVCICACKPMSVYAFLSVFLDACMCSWNMFSVQMNVPKTASTVQPSSLYIYISEWEDTRGGTLRQLFNVFSYAIQTSTIKRPTYIRSVSYL